MRSFLKSRGRAYALLFVMALMISGACRQARAQDVNAQAYVEILQLAMAKSEAQDWKEAAAAWQRVVEANPVNARFWNSFGDAAYGNKDYRRAIQAYEKALELGGGFPSNAAYNIACCYALLGEKEQAFKWLQKAFDMGFRNLAHSQTDSDLQSLHDDPRFAKIVGLADVTRMTRDEGWRFDLALLAREVKRKGYAPGVARQLSKEEFDVAVGKLNNDIPKLTDAQILIELMKLMRKLGDGHTGILGRLDNAEAALAVPLQFYLFKEGLFVIAADPQHKDLLGAQVLRFGDSTVTQVMQALDPLMSRDNDFWPNQVGPYRMRSLPLLHGLGLIPDARKVNLAIKDAQGKERVVTVAANGDFPNIWNDFPKSWLTYAGTLDKPLPLYLKNMAVAYWFEYLPESKVLYFQYNRVRNEGEESLAKFTERLFKFVSENEVDKLVIDMRWNNGGNTFLSQPLLYALIRNDKINKRGKLFVIIGRRTYSAAQNTTSFFERHTNAIFVGEPTGSSPNFIGEETIFTLPYSKVLANVSDLYWQSAWPMDYRTWIAPHIYAPPTFAAFSAGRDPALEAIIGLKQ
ncbi:MAG TPA: tetratricopeptide repeat protein [Pyrinomonadaceae bacterium]|nr:tetratricopeptide repeat protein [Pyrinomonadaceae bacterium]